MECQKTKNLKNCNCSFSCSRKGLCCECLAYHKDLGELPACYFPKEIEKTGERSVTAYLKIKNML